MITQPPDNPPPPGRRDLLRVITGLDHPPDLTPAQAILTISAERDQWTQAVTAAYDRGRRDGQAEASVFSAVIHADEEAAQHYADRRMWLMTLSRNEQFLAEARAAKPWKRTYEQRVALALRGGFRLAPRTEPFDPDFDPAGSRATGSPA